MIALVVTLKIKDGKQAEFEAIAAELVAAVRANEPGNKQYTMCKKDGSATEYVFIEQYVDDAAIAAHRATEHFRTLGAKFGACMEGRPEVMRMEVVL
jgi:quinol monooxygenase YgiN